MSPLGMMPSGPRLPEYSTPFTLSLSYLFSVRKLSTTIGTATDSFTVIVQSSFAPYADG